ncbi:hypothetical protein, partial [Cupriavidus plantarum]|uniref:hypothetical protein n=1 Tax=Cupriavidus plantarum TaxID=942865 RepID=UPI00339DA2E8
MPNASSMPSGSETPTHAVGRCQPVRRASRDGSNVGGDGNGNADGNGNVWMSADRWQRSKSDLANASVARREDEVDRWWRVSDR